MLVLGIETTCDETAAAVVERQRRRQRQDPVQYRALADRRARAAIGGVVPEIAARAMSTCSTASSASAMKDADVGFAQLIGGGRRRRTRPDRRRHRRPHHRKGDRDGARHAADRREPSRSPRADAAADLRRLAFPYCLFLASGGHTQIVAVVGVGHYVRLGTTVDDAMGEAFDKVAKMLALPYPGGPQVERAAAGGDPQAVCLSAADARPARCEFFAVGSEDRGSQRGQPADAAGSRRTSRISAPASRPRCWNRPRIG